MADDLCAKCSAPLKVGARFCVKCGQATGEGEPTTVQASAPVQVVPAPVTLPATAQVSPDGKWWWNGTQWVAMPQAASSKQGKWVLAFLLLVLIGAVAVVALITVPRLINPNANPRIVPAKPLGPGPYYLHYNCSHNSDCISTSIPAVLNEGNADGGNTGIGGDYQTLAVCQGIVSMDNGSSTNNLPAIWCSTSTNPADTHG